MSDEVQSEAANGAGKLGPNDPKLKELKGRAQKIEPLVRLSHEGVTPGLLKALNDALDIHGLVKVRFVALKDQKKALARELEEQTHAKLVLAVGHTATYFRTPKKAAA